ncbi:MAG: cation diffusion facilitator family transporter [Eubacteriales bacterium]|jgi:cation diffusion facilitator family transporter|nr:cation diffusion facilitator family transporter [Oscillospiraceae bacterium]MDD4774328.1 cation diffusion facilitator family transporter [Eubacteriales bacterium]
MVNNYKKVLNLLIVILFANFLVCAVKLVIGNITGCLSLQADGFHSLADGSSNVIGIIGILISSRPSDFKHPYGHRKFEVLSCLFIGLMLGYLCIKVAVTGIYTLIYPGSISFTPFELMAVGSTILINIIVSVIEYKLGKKWGSSVLVADSIHTKSDILISSGVLAGITAMRFGLPPQIDGAISLFVSACIAYSCVEILKPAISTLVDSRVVDAELITLEVKKFLQVMDVHKVRSRGVQNDIYIDMHVIVNPLASVIESHTLAHDIENALQNLFGKSTQVNVHIEPFDETTENNII